MYEFYFYSVSIRDIISIANVLLLYNFASLHAVKLRIVLKSKLKNESEFSDLKGDWEGLKLINHILV